MTKPNIDKLTEANKAKERAERHLRSCKGNLQKTWQRKRDIQLKLQEADDYSRFEKLQDEMLAIESEIAGYKEDIESAQQDLKEAKTHFDEVKSTVVKEYAKWADAKWSKLKKQLTKADEVAEEMIELGRKVHRQGGIRSVHPDGLPSDVLKGRGVWKQFSPENQLKKLKKAI